ncbi:uncharacterized protein LOC123839428 isoform X7 [Mirounga angustirostris]|uniref:uncharacterized protein LOC123839428 isoform X7 n=1 Tax=Mirounga angustirostris TaxID=9716 RepID=UPI00313ABA21
MFCKGNTATCLPSMVIGASHPVAMWKADKLSSYCQGPRGACRRYSASLAFRAPIQRSGSNFIDTRKLSKNNLPLKCGNLKCELPNTMQSSIDIFIPFPRPLCIEQLHRCREDFISDKKDAEIKHPCRKSQLCGVISFYLGEFHNNSVTPPERHPSWYACTSSFQCQLVLTHM